MAKYVMVALSAARDGRDGDYNAWYDGEHLRDICSLPGVISGRRLVADAASPMPTPAPYMALYEIETDDIAGLMAEMGRRSHAGEISTSDALDPTSAKLWFYKAL